MAGSRDLIYGTVTLVIDGIKGIARTGSRFEMPQMPLW